MSSVLSATAQIPRGGDYFVAYQTTAGAVALNDSQVPTSATSGVTSVIGSSFVFSSAATANTATLGGTPIIEGDTFISLGKKLYFYVAAAGNNNVPMIYAVLEKVRRVGDAATAGGLFEGGGGTVTDGAQGVAYVVTWSAAPGTTPVAVIRSGRTNGGW